MLLEAVAGAKLCHERLLPEATSEAYSIPLRVDQRDTIHKQQLDLACPLYTQTTPQQLNQLSRPSADEVGHECPKHGPLRPCIVNHQHAPRLKAQGTRHKADTNPPPQKTRCGLCFPTPKHHCLRGRARLYQIPSKATVQHTITPPSHHRPCHHHGQRASAPQGPITPDP